LETVDWVDLSTTGTSWSNGLATSR
jgi:hypothetical protein